MISKPALLLLGYSGRRNFGDDLLLLQACNSFSAFAELHIHTSLLGSGSAYLPQWFPEAIIHKSTKVDYFFLKKFKYVLYFGGGVFFEYRSLGIKYYLKKRLSHLINFSGAKLSGTRFAGIGIGIGPFKDRRGVSLCKSQLMFFDFLGVRDETSFNFCKRNHLIKNISLAQDLSIADYQKYHSYTIAQEHRKKRIIICCREYPHGDNKNLYLQNLMKVSHKLKEDKNEILIVGFQSGHDEEVLHQFKASGFDVVMWNPDNMRIEDMLTIFADSRLVISSRMHGIFVAGMLEVPVIGIGVHPKLQLASQLFSQSICLPDNFNIEDMQDAIHRVSFLAGNDSELLKKNEIECKLQYDKAISWLQNDLNAL